jgi:beta-glucosidase
VDVQSVREKAAQMAQVDIYSMVNGDERDPARALNEDVVAAYARQGVGSILNAPFFRPMPSSDHVERTGWTAGEWRVVMDRIKTIYRQFAKVPMIYGVDSIHGATYVRGATLFPQAISAAAAFNPLLAEQMGEITAKDTLAAGIPWVFSPVLGVAVQPKWSRVYETFGEDPFVASELANATISGLQRSGRVAACMKHFIGYSNVLAGLDRADNTISQFDLMNYFAPPFRAAVHAGVKTAMETYVSVNGLPVIASHALLTTLLRKDMGFTGMLVSDYSEIDRMVYEHRVASTVPEAIRVSLSQTSLDMNMGPGNLSLFLDTVESLVASGEVSEERLDASVTRILNLKRDLGVLDGLARHWEEPLDPDRDHEVDLRSVGSAEDQAVALDLARESVILLENKDATLPFIRPSDSTNKSPSIFLTGPASDNKGYLCGGWSVFWQGSSNSSHFPNGKTIKEAVAQESQRTGFGFEHVAAVDINGNSQASDVDKALAIAARSDYTVVVLGEHNYAEKEGDIDNLVLPSGQLEYLQRLTQIKTTKVVLVLVTGRPRLLHNAHKDAHAVLLSMLPCEQGGQAISDVLFGNVNPSAKLPITYPRNEAHLLPYYHRINTVCSPWTECPAQWRFGFGRSFTTFTYSDLSLSPTQVSAGDTTATIEARVTVTNSGTRPGKEVVLLFISQPFRAASTPEQKLLKRFLKIDLAPGERKQVAFTLSSKDWSYYVPSADGEGVATLKAEPGEFVVSVMYTTDAPSEEDDGGVDRSWPSSEGHEFSQRMWWRDAARATRRVSDGTAELTGSFHVV